MKRYICCPQDVAEHDATLALRAKEQFVVILLNNKNKVIGTEVVSEGSLSSSIVHPREVFAPALLHHAAAIMVAHNHPSGDPKPSIEDEEITRLLLRSGKVLGIPMIDHVIIGDGNYYSFLENEAF